MSKFIQLACQISHALLLYILLFKLAFFPIFKLMYKQGFGSKIGVLQPGPRPHTSESDPAVMVTASAGTSASLGTWAKGLQAEPPIVFSLCVKHNFLLQGEKL